MADNYEINTEIVFSTAHISEQCNEDLSRHCDNPKAHSIRREDFGYRIDCHLESALAFPETGHEELDKLIRFARQMKCKWLVLDRDGPVHKDMFETFGW